MRALLIDLDGTLADSMDLCWKVFANFHARHGKEANREVFERWVGPSISEMVPALCRDWGLPFDDLLDEYQADLERDYSTQLSLFPGAAVFLDLARQRGLQLALVTSAPKDLVEALIAREGLRFDVLVTGDDIEESKPHPEIYLRALDLLDCPPEQAVAIEDSPSGIRAALAAEIDCIQFAPGGQPSYPGSTHRYFHWQQLSQALLHPECTLTPLSKDVEIASDAEFMIADEIREQVDKLWSEQKMRRPELFDGQVFCCQEPSKGKLLGQLMPYRYVLAQHLQPQLRASIGAMPVGVTGITQQGGKVLVGRRGRNLTHYPGMRELAPAGVLDQLNWREQLLTELREECGWSANPKIPLLGLIYDPIIHTLDIVAELKVDEEGLPEPNEEYSSFAWLRPEDILRSLASDPGQWAPTTAALKLLP